MNHIPYHIPNIPIYNIIYSHLFRYIPIYYIPYIGEFCLNFAKGTDPPPAATTPLPPWGDGCARAKHEAAARFERWGLGVSTKASECALMAGFKWKDMVVFYLVGGFNLPLWKMMEWKSVGMMTFPTEWKNKKCSKLQTTNQSCFF